MKFSNYKLTVVASAILLAACGGGGGGTSTPSTYTPVEVTPTPSTPVTDGGTLATSVPAPTYAANSLEAGLFATLNDVRLKGGFGMLAQSVETDTAALNHANYINRNFFTRGGIGFGTNVVGIDTATGQITAHIENSSWPGFTGLYPIDRVRAAGGNIYTAAEAMSFNGPDCITNLLNTVFHRTPLLSPTYQYVGFGYAQLPDTSSTCVVNSAQKIAGGATIPTDWVGYYPGKDQVNVPVAMPFGETPDPAPSIPQDKKGSPISIYLSGELAGDPTFTLTAAGESTPIPVQLVRESDFPSVMGLNESHIVPTQNLKPKTQYTVNFSGTINNANRVPGSTKVVTKTWSFTTK